MGRVRSGTLCALIAVMALAGCGGSSDEEARAEIEEVLETTFTTSDPEQCDQITLKGIEEISPTVAAAEDPFAECRKSLDPSAEAESIEVTDVAVDGEQATAKVTPEGGILAGATVTLAFVDDDGWKLDGIEDVEVTDVGAQLAFIDAQAAGSFGNEAFTPDDASCISDQIRATATKEQLERAITGDDRAFVYDAVRICMGGGTDLIALMTILRNQLVAEGLDPKTADCVAGASIAGQKGATLEDLAESSDVQERIAKAAKRSAQFCVR